MKIAIIGATGSMGSALTKSLAKAGHEIYVYAPHADKLSALITALKKEIPKAKIVKTADSAAAAAAAEIIIPAVWYDKQREVANAIRSTASGKIVVNLVNPLNATYDGLVTPPDTSAAEEMAKLLPDSKIVKALNTAFAGDYASPEFGGTRPDIFIASDDQKAAETVARLVEDAGFNPLYAGKLSMSRIIENMMVLLIGLTTRYNYNWVAGWKVLHR